MLPSGLPESVADTEHIARFLTSSSHYNSKVIKPAAFMPNPNDGYTTSVFRHDEEPIAALWMIADASIKGRKCHGAAIVLASMVRDASLEIAALEPPERHANIVNWVRGEDPQWQKARQKDQAMAIVKYAKRLMR